MKSFKNGLLTGLTLQIAIGPVFFYIINLALQKTIYDGFAGVLAVTIVDFLYITLAILGIGKLLEKQKIKKSFGIISSIVLILFGIFMIYKSINTNIIPIESINSVSLLSSFLSVFILTISSPMTIVFFTSIFTAKAIEHKYTKGELYYFGFGTGLATLIFMGLSVAIFAIIKGTLPLIVIQTCNIIVGALLIVYGLYRIFKIWKNH